MKKNNIKYGTDFKKSVLKKLQSGEIKSIEEARRKYSIGGKMTVQRWIKELKILPKVKKSANVIHPKDYNTKLLAALGKSYLRIMEMESRYGKG